jgi:hypothetical protein
VALIVVLAVLGMLAIVALAIDMITLYSAAGPACCGCGRISGGKMLVDMGVTADPPTPACRRRPRLTLRQRQRKASPPMW